MYNDENYPLIEPCNDNENRSEDHLNKSTINSFGTDKEKETIGDKHFPQPNDQYQKAIIENEDPVPSLTKKQSKTAKVEEEANGGNNEKDKPVERTEDVLEDNLNASQLSVVEKPQGQTDNKGTGNNNSEIPNFRQLIV